MGNRWAFDYGPLGPWGRRPGRWAVQEVQLSLWSHRREPIGTWTIGPGDNVVLEADGAHIKVRPSYKIKVGEDWGWVNLGEVGQFQQGTWFVSVRAIWSATHRARGGVPDWKR